MGDRKSVLAFNIALLKNPSAPLLVFGNVSVDEGQNRTWPFKVDINDM